TQTRGGERLGLGDLPVGRACRCADIPERVPTLIDDHSPMPVVQEADVDRARRFERLRRQLERAGVAGRVTEPEGELLHRKVWPVPRLGEVIATERDEQRHPEGDADALPG